LPDWNTETSHTQDDCKPDRSVATKLNETMPRPGMVQVGVPSGIVHVLVGTEEPKVKYEAVSVLLLKPTLSHAGGLVTLIGMLEEELLETENDV